VNDALPHVLERTVWIQADRRTVFSFFTDSVRWAKWWGAGSSIDARRGGRVSIRYPNGALASGEVLDIAAPERLVFSFGYDSGNPIPPGHSRVEIRLEAQSAGTRLHLSHFFAEAEVRDQHVQGWRYQLSVFANVIADEVFADATPLVDAWFEAWSIVDPAERRSAFEKIASEKVRYSDRFSALESLTDLTEHAGALQRFMPGVRLQREGAIRHCQGAVLANWTMSGGRGPAATGTHLFMLSGEGRILAAVGFANSPSG
jgi:uncharacterized protein YndB with AHSA1/START domain